jgi:transcriptional regulator with XRE-family HTH domain
VKTELHRLRRERGLSQTRLADLVGVTQTTIVNYDRGRGWPEKATVRERLEAVLGAPVTVLLEAEKPNGAVPKDNAAVSESPTRNVYNG